MQLQWPYTWNSYLLVCCQNVCKSISWHHSNYISKIILSSKFFYKLVWCDNIMCIWKGMRKGSIILIKWPCNIFPRDFYEAWITSMLLSFIWIYMLRKSSIIFHGSMQKIKHYVMWISLLGMPFVCIGFEIGHNVLLVAT
jgi:hypothetical protein